MTTQPVDYIALGWTFGDKVRKIRRAASVNQEEFAESIGHGRKAVAAWELGTNTPRNMVAIAKRIELAYGVAAAWTLGLTENPRPDGRGPDGNPSAHSEGLEPPTFWSGVNGKLIPGPWNLEAVAA